MRWSVLWRVYTESRPSSFCLISFNPQATLKYGHSHNPSAERKTEFPLKATEVPAVRQGPKSWLTRPLLLLPRPLQWLLGTSLRLAPSQEKA